MFEAVLRRGFPLRVVEDCADIRVLYHWIRERDRIVGLPGDWDTNTTIGILPKKD